MVKVRWTLQASEDFASIVGFIAKDSEQYASLFVTDVFQAVARISDFPESGRIVLSSWSFSRSITAPGCWIRRN